MSRTIAILVAIAAITALAVALILAMINLQERSMERRSLEERVATLEEMMREKTRPVIHIERGTVYNSDGEVVIEEVKKEQDSKKAR